MNAAPLGRDAALYVKSHKVPGPKTHGCLYHMHNNRKVCILGFLKQSLLPEHDILLLAVDSRMEDGMKSTLKSFGIDLIEIPPFNGLAEPVAGHADMHITHIRDNVIVCQPDLPEKIYEKLEQYGFDIHIGNTALQTDYPLDVAYNVAIVGDVAFHNIRYTDSVILKLLHQYNIRTVHVNQGYTKCSLLPVSNNSIITDDPSIEKAALSEGFEVLKIPPQKNIRLPGYSYGFIGGTAGFIGRNMLAFAGSLEMLDSSDEIKNFLNKHNVKWVNLGCDKIFDRGSLIPLFEKF